MQIALKECYETENWLELLSRAGLLPSVETRELLGRCGTIRRLLIASLNTAKGGAHAEAKVL